MKIIALILTLLTIVAFANDHAGAGLILAVFTYGAFKIGFAEKKREFEHVGQVDIFREKQ